MHDVDAVCQEEEGDEEEEESVGDA